MKRESATALILAGIAAVSSAAAETVHLVEVDVYDKDCGAKLYSYPLALGDGECHEATPDVSYKADCSSDEWTPEIFTAPECAEESLVENVQAECNAGYDGGFSCREYEANRVVTVTVGSTCPSSEEIEGMKLQVVQVVNECLTLPNAENIPEEIRTEIANQIEQNFPVLATLNPRSYMLEALPNKEVKLSLYMTDDCSGLGLTDLTAPVTGTIDNCTFIDQFNVAVHIAPTVEGTEIEVMGREYEQSEDDDFSAGGVAMTSVYALGAVLLSAFAAVM